MLAVRSIVPPMDEAVSVGSALAWAGDVGRQWGRWVRAHLGMTIVLSILAFAFGWVWNTYVMAVNLDGSVPLPDEETIATAQGRPFNSLFWLLLFSLVSGVITYGWQRGWRNLLGDLAVLPRRFGQTMSLNATGAFAMLLWGLSVSLIISTLISSAVSLALGLVLLTLAATPVGTIINFAFIRIWKALTGIVAPSGGMGAVLVAGPFLVMLGEAAGLLLDWLFASWLLGLILGAVAALASILLARRVKPANGAMAGVLIGLAVAFSEFWPSRAWGDDGGWSECQGDSGQPCSEMGLAGVFAWLGSDGAGTVITYGALGGAGAAVGTAIGVGLGSVAAGLAMAAASAAARVAPPPSSKAMGHAAVPPQGGPQPGQQLPPQSEPQQGAMGQQPPPEGQPQIPEQQAPTNQSAAWQTVGFEEPTVAQPPMAPMAPIDDVLPEPSDRKRGKEDGQEDGKDASG
jgi:hypothetical protein